MVYCYFRRHDRPKLRELQTKMCRLSDVAESADVSAQSGPGSAIRAVHHGLYHMQHGGAGHRTSRHVGERAKHFGCRKQGKERLG